MRRLNRFVNFVNELKKTGENEISVENEIKAEALKVASMMFDKTSSPIFTYDEDGLPNSIEFGITNADYKLDYEGEEMKTDYSEGVMKKRRYQVSLFYVDKYIRDDNYRIKFDIKLTPTSEIKYNKQDFWIVWEFENTPTEVLSFLEGDEDEGFPNYLDSEDVDFTGSTLRIKNSLYKRLSDDLDDLIDEEGGIKVKKEPIS